MSLLTKVVTSVFGKKSDKDLKILSPFVDVINNYYNTLVDLTDEELKSKFASIFDEFKKLEEEFKNNEIKYKVIQGKKNENEFSATKNNLIDEIKKILK